MRLPLLACLAACLTVPLFAAAPLIGVATAVGGYSVDSLPASGTTNLVEGTSLKTASSPSDIHLDNGASVRLATRSAGTLFSDHVVLDQGAVRVNSFSGYQVNAGQFLIQADSPEAQAVVRFNKKTIEVASLGGALRVTDGGAMLTRVASGTKMSFRQSGASPGQPQQVAQTGAAPAPRGPSDRKTLLWVIGITAAAALAIGLTAAAQGKSPF
jgi:hypothetical protein